MKKIVLFDFHNTLVTCDAWLDLEIRTLPGLSLEELRRRGALEGQPEHSPEEAVRLFKQLRERVRASGVELSALDGANEVLQEMGYSFDAAELESVVAQLEYSCLADTGPVPGAAEALDVLRGEGVRLGVVSSAGFPPFVEKALERFDLRRFFDEVLTSAGEGIYKSDPEIFRRAVARLDGTPDEAVHVGDHAMYDVDAAARAGLSTIWFAREAERTARLHGHDWEALQRTGSRADAVVTDLRDVPAAVKRL